MTSEIELDPASVVEALAAAGMRESLRRSIFEALRLAEVTAPDATHFRETVRWPVLCSMLRDVDVHRVELADGLVFEFRADSRIEKALLLSREERPDHVWEPQTTKLLVELARGADHVIVGGAYIGDHVLPIAKALGGAGVVHAFEPMKHTFALLQRNVANNKLANVIAHRRALWDSTGEHLTLDGALALGSSVPVDDRPLTNGSKPDEPVEVVMSLAIGDYVQKQGLVGVDLIMLDIEGGEERALTGAAALLDLPPPHAPDVVFEVHRTFVDWSDGLENTALVQLMTTRGYTVYAVRDFHDNWSMVGEPIEVIPVDRVHLDGPPHGFNLLASKDADLVQRLDLRIVENVSPKLIVDRDPKLHHPVGGLKSSQRRPA